MLLEVQQELSKTQVKIQNVKDFQTDLMYILSQDKIVSFVVCRLA